MNEEFYKEVPDFYLTPHFRLYEFLTPELQDLEFELYMDDPMFGRIDGNPLYKIVKRLEQMAWILETIRCHWNRPITINSGFRTRQRNASLPGSAPDSFHMKARAVDFWVKNVDAASVQTFLQLWPGGLGRYDGFTHIDIGELRRW